MQVIMDNSKQLYTNNDQGAIDPVGGGTKFWGEKSQLGFHDLGMQWLPATSTQLFKPALKLF